MQTVEICKRGIGVVFTRPDGRVAMLTESNDSWITHKRTGDASIPMESTEAGESPEQVLERLNKEEITVSSFEVVGRLSAFFARPGVLVDIYLCRTPQAAEIRIGTAIDVYNAQWIDRSFVLNFPISKKGLRPGTRDAIIDVEAFERAKVWVPRVHLSTIDKVPDQYYIERGFEVRQDVKSELQYLQSAPVLP